MTQNFDPSTPINPETSLADPVDVQVISEPLSNPSNRFSFFLLTSDSDIVELTNDVIENYPGGIFALEGDDYVRGSENDEFIYGNYGQDVLLGKAGNDTIRGGQDFDVIAGGEGNDLLHGNRGNDRLYGNDDDDFVRGGQGDDEVVGGEGNDTIIGDLGVDKLWGGEGEDLFVLRTGTASTPQEIGSETPPEGDLFTALESVTVDIILDYNPADDIIGLTGGLTADDLILSERFVVIGDRRDYDPSGPFPLGLARTADFQIETIQVIVISEESTGNILGLVRDVGAEDLNFISVSNQDLAFA
jgi:serralysin